MATYTVKNTKSGATMQVSREEKQRLGPNWVVVENSGAKQPAPAPLPKVAAPATTAKPESKE